MTAHLGNGWERGSFPSCALLLLGALVALVSPTLANGAENQPAPGPRPGEVYREYSTHNGGNLAWRVTSPAARDPRARKFLPNPVLHVNIDSLEAAVRAEALLDRWGGHLGTIQPRLRFNGKAWLDVPSPRLIAEEPLPPEHYVQDNPIIPVPLEHLRAGDNTFEGTCSHEREGEWGQWGLYSLILRVYYDPEKVEHPTGRIISPVDGGVVGEDPTICLTAAAPAGFARIDLLAWYEGFDENGDGRRLDWHGGVFQPVRGLAAELDGHVGTVRRLPYDVSWDTRWVPDQQPGAVKLIARVQDVRGVWFVTQPVMGLTLERRGESVRLYRATELPARFGVRNHQTKSCRIPVGAEVDPGNVVEAGLHYRTWNGTDLLHHPFRFNQLALPNEGKNHHYDYDIHLLPVAALWNGDNTFTISSDTEHHMLEVLWPGPAVTVRYRTVSRAGELAPLGLDRWTYVLADDKREPTSKNNRGSFGISFGDLDGDGDIDLVSGRYFYRNPGADMTKEPWPRMTLPVHPESGRPLDAGLLFDVSGGGPPRDVIAQALPDIVWLHAADDRGEKWSAKVVAQAPPTRHGDGRTMRLAKIIPGNPRPDILLSAGGGTYLMQIPDKPEENAWPIMKITHTDYDEQKSLGLGDVDHDGHLDLVLPAGRGRTEVEWWRNPGRVSPDWVEHLIGHTENDSKMIEVADINGDGRLDAVVTDSEAPNCAVYWFEAPTDPVMDKWVRHEVARGYEGLDSLSVADMNRDLRPDIVIGETKGRRRLVVYVNEDGGKAWNVHLVDEGKESHKGAQAMDLDGDGDFDLVSIAYFAFTDLYVWRNDNK